jgi:hypothetical protein
MFCKTNTEDILNNMTWACFKNNQRENPTEGYEHETESRIPMGKTKIKMGATS